MRKKTLSALNPNLKKEDGNGFYRWGFTEYESLWSKKTFKSYRDVENSILSYIKDGKFKDRIYISYFTDTFTNCFVFHSDNVLDNISNYSLSVGLDTTNSKINNITSEECKELEIRLGNCVEKFLKEKNYLETNKTAIWTYSFLPEEI